MIAFALVLLSALVAFAAWHAARLPFLSLAEAIREGQMGWTVALVVGSLIFWGSVLSLTLGLMP